MYRKERLVLIFVVIIYLYVKNIE